MKKVFKYLPALIFIAVIAIQFVPVDRTNPRVTGDLKAQAEVKNILKTSCYDCHSNETKWPWYSYVAPVSWLVADDVEEGRKHLNFSEWESLPENRKIKKKEHIWEEISEDGMPLKKYTYMHPQATLNINQKNIIKKWVDGNSLW